MTQLTPRILALDFDGVICDGMLEYFQSTQRAYRHFWPLENLDQLEPFAEDFYRLRPLIETGWEMILLLRALVLAVPEAEMRNHWSEWIKKLLAQENLEPVLLAKTLDQVRDEWINEDLDGWLNLHRFYPGVIERLKSLLSSSTLLYVITTKEGRFVQKLLADQGLELDRENIIGKEIKQPKYLTLQQLLDKHSLSPPELWFVEDLLPTLLLVNQQLDLTGVGLFLADWGYNTEAARNSLSSPSSQSSSPKIHLLSLSQFSQDFSQWR
jgi:phosphoglycolate phosphatase-like HAD superfamily hydrolase